MFCLLSDYKSLYQGSDGSGKLPHFSAKLKNMSFKTRRSSTRLTPQPLRKSVELYPMQSFSVKAGLKTPQKQKVFQEQYPHKSKRFIGTLPRCPSKLGKFGVSNRKQCAFAFYACASIGNIFFAPANQG